MKTRRWFLIGLVVIVVGIRVALPYVVKHQINQSLQQSPDFSGYVEDVSLNLILGRFNLNGLHFKDKAESAVLYLPRLGLYIHWAALLHRTLLLAVHIQEPRVVIRYPEAMGILKETPEKAREKAEKLAKGPEKPTLRQTLRKLPRFRIDSVAMKNGQVKFTDSESKPEQVIWLREIDLHAVNLTNSKQVSESLYASVEMRLKTNETGNGSLKAVFNPTATAPTFGLHTQLTDVHLADFNPLFRHQSGLTVDQGQLSMFVEAAAAKGAFEGYVKPVIQDLKLANPDKKKPMKEIKKAVANTVTNVLENSKEELSTQVPIQGRFDDPNIGIGSAIGSILTNALTSALRPTLEGHPTLRHVQKNAPEIREKGK
jgi:hypothetical protein